MYIEKVYDLGIIRDSSVESLGKFWGLILQKISNTTSLSKIQLQYFKFYWLHYIHYFLFKLHGILKRITDPWKQIATLKSTMTDIFWILSLIFLFYCIFLLSFTFLIFPPPHNHHTVVHVHESFVLLAQSAHPLNPTPELSAYSLYMSLSLFCLLDSTYEWNHMVFIFLSLSYFT